MMKRVIFLAAIALIACQEDKVIETGLRGTLIGYVHTNITNTTVGDVNITVEGTFPQVTVKSDADGKFVIENLLTGTYNLVCEKPGYGTYKLMGYSFIGGSVPGNVGVAMVRLPNVKVKDLTVTTILIGEERRVEGTLSLDLSQRVSAGNKFRYYMSKNSTVSQVDYEETGIVTVTTFVDTPVKFYSKINTKRFQPGTDVYYVIYPCAEEYLSYIDLDTGTMIYCSIDLQGSQVKTIKVPL